MNYTYTGLDSIYFIRLITIVTTIYMHNLLQYLYHPTSNAADVEKVCTNIDHTYSDMLHYIVLCRMFYYYKTICCVRVD